MNVDRKMAEQLADRLERESQRHCGRACGDDPALSVQWLMLEVAMFLRALAAAQDAPAVEFGPLAPECAHACQYAVDAGCWPEHRCAHHCMYVTFLAGWQAARAASPAPEHAHAELIGFVHPLDLGREFEPTITAARQSDEQLPVYVMHADQSSITAPEHVQRAERTPIEQLVQKYRDDHGYSDDTMWLSGVGLRYAKTMRDSQARCILYGLAKYVSAQRAEVEHAQDSAQQINDSGTAKNADAEASGTQPVTLNQDAGVAPGPLSPQSQPSAPASERKKLEAAALPHFVEYFVRNYPGPNTIISNPNWHAPKIFRAAMYALDAARAALARDQQEDGNE